MSARFRVIGGVPLNGTVRPAGNKNAALPIIAASLMGDGPSEIHNVPRIRDVEVLLDLARGLGAQASWSAAHTVTLDPASLAPGRPDPDLCTMLRASILLAGPLLARFGRGTLPPPGGDGIGRGRGETHFLALPRLRPQGTIGADYQLEAAHLPGADIFLDEPSVTATENALMAAALARGTTVLRNAASEPHVQDLARALTAMGAGADGNGPPPRAGPGAGPPAAGGGGMEAPRPPPCPGAAVGWSRHCRLEVGPDHIEVGSFIGLA